jgi:putative addiction module killer protein
MSYTVETLPEFNAFFDGLRDHKARLIIADRLERLAGGLFGDCEPIGDGVSELRIHFGPGYRAYFVMRKQTIIIVLCGGSKHTQKRDIKRAKELAKDIRR